MKRYFKIWWIMASASAQSAVVSRFGTVLFVLGKLLRFVFFLLFLLLLASKTKSIAGYSLWQIIFFYATYNLIDTVTQLFFREVYRFRSYIISGNLDFFLIKPMSPLFRCLFGGTDVLDIPLLFISIAFIVVAGMHLPQATWVNSVLYLFFLINAFVIAASFHIAILAFGILTTTVDNAIWMYRDLTLMGRLPIDVYKEPVRGFLTFIIPIGIMMTYPSKVLLGLLTPWGMLTAVLFGIVFLSASLYLWEYSLQYYASASS